MKKQLFILLIVLILQPLDLRASGLYFCVTQETQIYDQPNEENTPINSAKTGETFVYLNNVYSEAVMSRKIFARVIANNAEVYIPSNNGEVVGSPSDCDIAKIEERNRKFEEIQQRGKKILEEQEKKRAAEEKQRLKNATLADRKRQETIKATGKAKGWPTASITRIINREVSVGMTSEMVLLSWGKPERRNKTVTANGTDEQWVYSLHEYIYLRNGIVTAIQTSN